MSKAKQSVWQNLAAIGKSILAHVIINYDGATGSLHIDIIPTDPAAVIADCKQMTIEQPTDIKALPDGTPAGSQNGKKANGLNDTEESSVLNDISSPATNAEGETS